MNNIIAFDRMSARRTHATAKKITNNVVSFVDWKNAPHPIRTPNGVFFSSEVWRFCGDVA